jgi:hypothetical protein
VRLGRSRPRLRLAGFLILVAAGPARAQTGGQDSVQADQARPLVALPIPAMEVAPGPLSPGARLVFSRDSMVWLNGYTLADLLADVPGVYVARTGFAGQPSPILYGGRGSAGVEILYDGVPMVALGADSLIIDPGRISLVGLRRVEVERHPAFLRIYLVSERSERVGTRSYLRVVNGDFKSAGYAVLFQHRWRNGIGLDLTGDYLNTKGGQGLAREARWFDMRAAVDWTPSPLVSARFQFRSLTLDREATATQIGLAVPLRGDSRRESLLRLVASTRPDRQGLSVEAGVQSISWEADSATTDTLLGERTANLGFVGVRAAGPLATVDLVARVSDYHTPLAADLTAGWQPLGWVTLSGGGRWASHDGDRRSRAAWASLGLHGGAFSLAGDVRWSDAVAAPARAADTAQPALDLGVRAGVTSRRLTLHAGIEERDAYAPPTVPPLGGLPALLPSPGATYAVSDLSVTLGALTLAGWYANPVSGETPDFQPPSHSRGSITFRSQFAGTFPSRAFELKVQIALEAWSAGVAGVDGSGTPIPLPAASIGEAFLQVKLVDFHAFYSLKNALRSREGFVPGYEYPRNRQTFGVKWLFHD